MHILDKDVILYLNKIDSTSYVFVKVINIL